MKVCTEHNGEGGSERCALLIITTAKCAQRAAQIPAAPVLQRRNIQIADRCSHARTDGMLPVSALDQVMQQAHRQMAIMSDPALRPRQPRIAYDSHEMFL
jgi:hypothetical protein